MSDADDSGFDKEAERERLREKYEDEKENRAAAEQMSDLLLKGATMTNAHCGTCGSPIFRQNGQEFCPNCSAQAAETADAAEAPAHEQPDDGADRERSPDEQLADVIASDDADDDATPDSTGGTSIADRAAASVRSADDPSQSDAEGSPASSEPETQTTPPSAGDASLADAQQSLLNAIVHHARAAATADPRTARDHLEAANEAAEALAEISQ